MVLFRKVAGTPPGHWLVAKLIAKDGKQAEKKQLPSFWGLSDDMLLLYLSAEG